MPSKAIRGCSAVELFIFRAQLNVDLTAHIAYIPNNKRRPPTRSANYENSEYYRYAFRKGSF
jgi:hypothetical protein